MPKTDNVEWHRECMNCLTPIDTWLTDDGPGEYMTLSPSEVDHFYTVCHGCDCYIEFLRSAVDSDVFKGECRVCKETDKVLVSTRDEIPGNGPGDYELDA